MDLQPLLNIPEKKGNGVIVKFFMLFKMVPDTTSHRSVVQN
jgi:hypothetical protein